MTYARPDYQTLKQRIEADLALMPAVLREPLAAMWARATHGVHGLLDWVHAQCSPLTCELERLYDWAALYGTPRINAIAAAGQVITNGINGTAILADTMLRGQNGLDYVVLAAASIVDGSATLAVRCTAAGANGNLSAGQTLTVIDPISGVVGSLTVDAAGLTGGADIELVDNWRVRVADEWQTVVTTGPRSGKPEDYRAWARAAHPDVTTALVQVHVLGIGTVLVRPICNSLPLRQPTQTILDLIAEKYAEQAPATADWRLADHLNKVITPSIQLQPGADNANNRSAITAAINTAILSEVSEGAVFGMAELDAAIATVTTQYTRLSPVADITAAPGEVFVFGGVNWA